MQITSMSNRELLYLLTGQKCNGVISNEIRDMIYSTPVRPESYWGKINKDRFESSDSVVFEGSSSGDGKKTDRFEYSGNDDIDFNDKAVQWEIDVRTNQAIFSHLTSSRQSTRPFIAEYFGRVAKRLDEAYAEGKFTEEEYNYLNEGISKRMEYYISRAEKSEAEDAVWRKQFAEDTKRVLKSFSKTGERNNFIFMTREERQAEFRDEVEAYIERHLKHERKFLMELFNNVRYGKNQKPTEKVFQL